jgi:serine/threonine protein kinase
MISQSASCDWWSVGVIIFELLSGWSLSTLFPSGVKLHVPIPWSGESSDLREGEAELRDLVSRFLQPVAELRLTNPDDIKAHKFFRGVTWNN